MKTMWKRLTKRLRSNGGFSLVETMLAMTFLSVGLMSVAQMIPAGLAGVTQARVRTIAVQAAQERLDEIRSASLTDPELQPGTYAETNGNYTLGWTVTNNAPVVGSRRIDMSVTWQSSRGTQSADLTTYVTGQ